MATAPITALTHIFLTQLLLDIKAPNQFLRDMLFRNRQTFPTETLQMDSISRGREIAPFVARDAEAIIMGGAGGTAQTVTAPNIRIKKAFTPSPLLFGREPGGPVFIPGGGGQSLVERAENYIAREVQALKDTITNAEEWMVAQSLQGQITYSVVGGDTWRITYPRASANNVTLTDFYDDTVPANLNLDMDVHTVKSLMSEDGFSPTDAICGTTAALWIRKLITGGHVKTFDILRISGNSIDLGAQYQASGAIYIGTISGVRFWEYSRKATLNGVLVDMIRPKYIEFVDNNQNADRVMMFAAIPDFDLMQGGTVETEIFSKSWTIPDPSSRQVLAHSRPLPWHRRPNSTLSMKVISGA